MTPRADAGWYPDRREPGVLRYWDGEAWTPDTMATPRADAEHTVPLSFRPPVSRTASDRATGQEPAPRTRVLAPGGAPVPSPPWHTRWWVVGGVALVVGLLVGAAVTGGRDLQEAAGPPVAAPSATVTVTASPSESATPSPSASPYSETSDGPAATFAMPDEIGKYLQDAQDDLQSISGKPFFYTGSSDASGQGRAQIIDSGWKVCDQSVTPGTQVSVDDRSISFGTVKLDEECP